MKVLLLGGQGYVGSALLRDLRARGHVVGSHDLEWFGGTLDLSEIRDYAGLSKHEIGCYDAVVLVAGHSSVGMCRNRTAAFRNNVQNFVDLVAKLHPRQRLVYASSVSVYGDCPRDLALEEMPVPIPAQPYDLTMLERDLHAALSFLPVYGLRFGTVCGAAPHTRTDVMLNRMWRDALEHGRVRVTNPDVRRPVLGIRDLCSAIAAVLEHPLAGLGGVFNLASFNATVGELGERAAKHLGVPLTWWNVPDQRTPYDVAVSTAKFRETFGWEPRETVESILDSFTATPPELLTERTEPRAYGE
jgi:nucleoside-diphosphate-sugar epimerase